MRQSEGRRAINRGNRTRVRSQIRKLRAVLTTGNADELGELLQATVSIIDKAVQKGALHRTALARQKAGWTRPVNNARSKKGEPQETQAGEVNN